MVHEATKESYPGVLCRWCRQPIPAPPIVTAADATHRKHSSQPDLHSKVFHLRCRACENEFLYKTSDIREFEGKPRTRVYPAHAVSHPPPMQAKAANG
jgi:hypothetical protein